MSTTHVPRRAYGLYFPSEETAQEFLNLHGVEFDSDGFDEEMPHFLVLTYVTYYDEYFLGFTMSASAPTEEFEQLWNSKFGEPDGDNTPEAYLLVDQY